MTRLRVALLGALLALLLVAWWRWPTPEDPGDAPGREETLRPETTRSGSPSEGVPHLEGHPAASAGPRSDDGSPLPPRAIRGRVRTAKLAPVAGATVWLAAPPTRPRGLPLSLFTSSLTTVESAVRLARTDASGAFEIRDGPPGGLVAGALAEGYGQAEAIVLDDGEDRPLDLLLGPEAVLEGDVVDAQGRGISGARILARAVARGVRENLFTQVAVETRSDVLGRFTLRGHPQGCDADLWVSADGFVPRSVEAERVWREDEGRHRILLRAARDLTVRVVELESGRTVEGALVVVEGFEADHSSWIGRGRSGPDGIARVPATLLGRSSLRALHPAYAPYGRSLEAEPLEEPWEAEVWLVRPATISGRVVDGGGRAVEGAHVAYPAVWEETVVTGEDGRWAFSNLRPTEGAHVRIHHPDFLPATAGPLAVAEGEVREVPDVVLRRGVRLVVEVADDRGAPLHDALVGLGEAAPAASHRFTDARGRVDLGPQAPGYVVVSVSRDGHRSEAHRVRLEGEGVEHVEAFRLPVAGEDD